MRWYEGNIAEAVAASKSQGAIFVVFVEGKDNKSKEFNRLIESEEISAQLGNNHFVAIRVEENSVPHQQFNQIYKQATVPSMFFIGKNGSPLEIITEPHLKVDFLQKLQQILQRHGVPISNMSIQTLIDEERSSSGKQENIVISESSDHISPSTSQASDDLELTSEQKIERAQELINKKRVQKQAEEDATLREKEIERRKMGQDVQKLKRWQQDQELKDLMEVRNKEKKEQLEARQLVLAQIAQDKAERASKFSHSPITPQPQFNSQQVVRNSNIARLQFRFPDGSTHTKEFSSNSTLQSVRNYIEENLHLPYQNFTLSTTFPRREFTMANGNDTLLDLQLVPNAVILILPLQNGAVSANSNTIMSLIWTVITPLLNVLKMLKIKLFGDGSGENSSTSSNTQTTNRFPYQRNDNKAANDQASSSIPQKKVGEANVIRRQGNVHRLRDNQDSDDDNNTWNGNSTQQM